jgi:hypothetical protein
MKKNALFRLALIGVIGLAIQNTNAGSAIALGPNNQLVRSAGFPVEVAKQHALAEARRKFGPSARIVAACDLTGYGAIAVARHPNGIGWIICVSLGKRSATEAETLAIQKCLEMGGKNPRVRWGFWG